MAATSRIKTIVIGAFVAGGALALAGQAGALPTLERLAKGVAVTRLDAEIRPAQGTRG